MASERGEFLRTYYVSLWVLLSFQVLTIPTWFKNHACKSIINEWFEKEMTSDLCHSGSCSLERQTSATMPTTRRQSAIAEGKIKPDEQVQKPASSRTRRGRRSSKVIKHGSGGDSGGGAVESKKGKKREAEQTGEDLKAADEEYLSKKSRTEDKSGIEEKQRIFKHGVY